MNTERMLISGVFLALGFFVEPVFAIQPAVGEVKDSRTTGQFFAGLEIEVKLVGDELADVQAMRTVLSKAVDDTGRDLIDKEKMSGDFEESSRFGGAPNSIRLQLKNPARKAANVSEITGEVELFTPSKDPNAVVVIPGFMKQTGKPLVNPALKAAGVEMTVLTKKDQDAKRAEEQKKAMEDAKAKGLDPKMAEQMGGFFSGMITGGENDLTFDIKDPSKKIVGVRLVDTQGKEIQRQSWMSMGGVQTYSYGQTIPQDASLEVKVLTPQSLTKVALNLTNIALP